MGSLEGLSDDALALRARAGDRAAMDLLCARVWDSLLRVALRVLRDPDLAQDAVQESLLDVLRGLDTWDQEKPVGPWLRTVCLHRALRIRRDHARRTCVDLPLENLVALDVAQEGDPDTTAHLRRCLQRLPPDRVELLRRRYLEGTAVQDLAAATGRTANAMAALLMRLRGALMRCCRGQGGDGDG
jgi:RNA polymerase sigma-70 factor, ECF subfamily